MRVICLDKTSVGLPLTLKHHSIGSVHSRVINKKVILYQLSCVEVEGRGSVTIWRRVVWLEDCHYTCEFTIIQGLSLCFPVSKSMSIPQDQIHIKQAHKINTKQVSQYINLWWKTGLGIFYARVLCLLFLVILGNGCQFCISFQKTNS